MAGDAPILTIDLGGTKVAAALVAGATILHRRQAATERLGGPAAWIDTIARLVADWRDYPAAGVAVTGLVRDGAWRALNPATLPVPDDFPLERTLRERLGVPVLARNDGQAAAWGEFRFGAGQGSSIVFLTISTGIGGGVIVDGRLLGGRGGLAGHVGITPIATPEGVRMLEEVASGTALARLAAGRADPPGAAAAAARGEGWAEALMDAVMAPLALALCRLQLVLDPDRMVIGGGLGLAPGYLARLGSHLDAVPAFRRPTICAAALGADAGLIGMADLARSHCSAGGQDR